MRDPTSFLRVEYEDLVKNAFDWKISVLQGPSSPWCNVDGKKVLMFCSNNYLGFSNHPRLKEAAIEAVKRSTFAPAQRVGKAVTSRAVLPVRFALKR